MSGLKLTMAATTTRTSIYGNPYNLVRTLATTNKTTNNHQSFTYFTFPLSSSSSSSPSSSLTLIRNNKSIPRTATITNLGFRSSSCGFKSRFSQPGRGGGGRDSSSSFVTNNKMGSVDKGDNADYHQQKPSSVPKQQQQSSSNHHHHQHSTKLLTLPTVLTLGRVAAVPLLVSTFYVNSWWGTTATTSIFIAAAITDWLDGYIARKMRLGTAFGAFLDPVADKLMVAATLILLCTRPPNIDMFGDVPWLLSAPSIAIIGREITMSAVREWAASQNAKLLEAVAVNNLGKWKTASQMTALTVLLATRDSSLAGPGALAASGVVLLYISAGLAVWSLAVYMRKISKVLLK